MEYPTPADLARLRSERGYPAVSLLAPTARALSGEAPVLVRNLAREARGRLLAELGPRRAEPVVDRLDRLIERLDRVGLREGLALFAGPETEEAYLLPVQPLARVVVDETFAVRDVLAALHRSARYWVLVLGEKPTRLYAGVRDELVEVRAGGFPLRHERAGGAINLPGGHGVNPSRHRDEQARHFFREADRALGAAVAAQPLPVVLVGVERHRSLFHEVARNADAVIGEVSGSHDATPVHALADLVWPVVLAHLEVERRGALAELATAVGARRYVSGLHNAWRPVHEGRAALLVVEEGYHAAAREEGLGLRDATDAGAPGVLDDAVDEVVEAVLARGGRVVFVGDGALAAHGRLAVVLRY